MKNFKLLYISILSIVFIFTFTACNRDKIKPGEKGPMKIQFENMLGESELTLSTGAYTNVSNETFSISKLQYYISNIQLKTSDGTVYTVPQDKSYFLIRQDNAASQILSLTDVPAADYSEITFMIGVDSLRNTMGVEGRTGDLDIAGVGADMYWSWNSGYIFFKMEGRSPQIPLDSTSGQRNFYYHIGGFGGYSSATINNIRKTTLSFNGDVAEVRDDRAPEVHVKADILKVFTGAKNIKLADQPTIMFSPKSVDISANYMNMFSVEHVHNDH